MILYKFKNLEPFSQVADLLMTSRLYCSHPSELNDPLEGVLGMSVPAAQAGAVPGDSFSRAARYWSAMDEVLGRYRICCFSETPASALMWSYYGNGNAGICLEIDVSDYTDKIVKVEYLSDLTPLINLAPKEMLRYKAQEWAHEREHRIVLNPEEKGKFIRADIKAVLIGAAIKSEYIRPLFELCRLTNRQKEIASFSTKGEFMRLPLNSNAAWDE